MSKITLQPGEGTDRVKHSSLPRVVRLLLSIREEVEIERDLILAARMATAFNDVEIQILDESGYLSIRDKNALGRLGRYP